VGNFIANTLSIMQNHTVKMVPGIFPHLSLHVLPPEKFSGMIPESLILLLFWKFCRDSCYHFSIILLRIIHGWWLR